MGRVIKDTGCPKCIENGRDGTFNHLMIFEDGGSKCNRCGYWEPEGSRDIVTGEALEIDSKAPVSLSKRVSPKGASMTLDEVQSLPIAALEARGIKKETCEHYGVRVEYDTTNGQERAYYYPITENNKAVAYRVRTLPKAFANVGTSIKGRKVELFGQSVCQKGGKKLLVCGGQDDMLAAFQMLKEKYPSFTPNVVSLTNGENTKSVADNLEFILSYEEVIIYTDMDEVGEKCAGDIAKLIGAKAKRMKTSEKDANDMLKQGKQAEFINAFFSAKTYTPVGIVEGGIGLSELMTPIKEGVFVDVLPDTMDKIKGFRKGELTLVLAPAGVGKTTISKEIGYALNKGGEKIVHVFLEEDLKKTQQSYIAIDNNVHLAKFRKDPSCISLEAAQKSYQELVENQLYLDHWGSMSPKEVMANFRYGASWGATFGILDHISMVFSGTETTNERKDIDMLLTDMAAFTRESGMHLIVISHIKRQNRAFRKSDAYPYWETVASDAGRGSGAFEQLADNIITLEVEYLDEDMNKGRIRTRVAKNREWSVLGVGDVLDYSLETGRISPVKRTDFGGEY